jgi:hypothetical protein
MIDVRVASLNSQREGRVLKFRRRQDAVHPPTPETLPIENLAKYERGEEADDYRHRMIVNAAAFAFVLALIGTGLWLADSMAKLRRNQDCVLAGHRNCAPIEFMK